MANPDLLRAAADVLEKTASYLDEQESEKLAAVRKERNAAVDLLAAQYEERSGESLAPDIREKLASSNDGILDTVRQMMDRTGGGAVESMGRGSDKTAGSAPQTKKERAEAAWNQFGQFLGG